MISLLFQGILFFYAVLAHAKSLNPGKRVDPEMFFHHTIKKIVLLDGTPPFLSSSSSSEIWCWDGTSWEKINTIHSPENRYAGASVYDKNRNVIITFGGRAGKNETINNYTWEWNSREWSILPDSLMPARDHHSMTYDEHRQKIVLFGGGVFPRSQGPWNTETWELDGHQWNLASSTGPEGRVTTMVYDNKNKVVILFGGVGAPGPDKKQPNFRDTWSWDGKMWQKLSDHGPAERSRHAMVYHKKLGKVILYGGEKNNVEQLGDMWQWDGKAWTEIIMKQPNPGKRRVHALAYDEIRDVMVLFGGMHNDELMSDTWEWDGKIWRRIRE